LLYVTHVLTRNSSIQELEFLQDSALLTPAQLSAIVALLPDPSSSSSIPQPPSTAPANVSLAEKQPSSYYNPAPSPAPPPPAYAPTSIATASALYAYNPTDVGDLALLPNDRIQVHEFMNPDWAKGRNERTHQEGIFPRSYVNIVEEKSNSHGMVPPPTPQRETNYGNMPLSVSQTGGGAGGGGPPSKVEENGKKFGKKLGNAGTSDMF
jgi:hypothetical protein